MQSLYTVITISVEHNSEYCKHCMGIWLPGRGYCNTEVALQPHYHLDSYQYSGHLPETVGTTLPLIGTRYYLLPAGSAS